MKCVESETVMGALHSRDYRRLPAGKPVRRHCAYRDRSRPTGVPNGLVLQTRVEPPAHLAELEPRHQPRRGKNPRRLQIAFFEVRSDRRRIEAALRRLEINQRRGARRYGVSSPRHQRRQLVVIRIRDRH